MTDGQSDDRTPGLEEQIKEMLKKANLSFMMPAAPVPEPAPPPPEEEDETEDERLAAIRDFNLVPRDIKAYLDRFVVQQDEAKEVLSVAICDHYNHVRRCIEDASLAARDYAKHNIILLGPSGVGKTYLMRCIAKKIGVPFVKADATKFTETGYVGHDVEDLVRDLVKAADGNIDLAQYGIIYVDEIDKIAAQATGGGKDVSGRGVQVNLLKLMEETDVNLFSQTDLIGQMQAIMEIQRGGESGKRSISTRHILFIVSGAFDRLAEQVRRRVSASRIGFAGDADRTRQDAEYLREASTSDFIGYGFEPEFIGRLPIRVVCDPLGAEDLEAIMLKSEANVLEQYHADLEGYGISFRMTRAAVKAVAQRAHTEKTGARGLMTVLERVFRSFKFELPSTPIRSFTVDSDTISHPDAALQQLLEQTEPLKREMLQAEAEKLAEAFRQETGLKLVVNKAGMDALIRICLDSERAMATVWEEHFHDLKYGLSLIARNTGRKSFTITRKLVQNPSDELSRRVAASFKKS